MKDLVKTVTDSFLWLVGKALFTLIVCTIAFKTIQISFFGFFVMGAEVFTKWNFWANTGLGLVLVFFSAYMCSITWNLIKKRFKRKE